MAANPGADVNIADPAQQTDAAAQQVDTAAPAPAPARVVGPQLTDEQIRLFNEGAFNVPAPARAPAPAPAPVTVPPSTTTRRRSFTDKMMERFKKKLDLSIEWCTNDGSKYGITADMLKKNVNALGQRKYTLLIGAAEDNKNDVLQELIQAGADVNAKDIDGNTALMIAVNKNEINNEVVKTLLAAPKIDVNAKNNARNSAFQLAQNKGHNTIFSEYDTNIVKKWKGIKPNVALSIEPGKDNRTLLNDAAKNGKLDIVQALIRLGSDVNNKDLYGNTALIEAVKFVHVNVVKELLMNSNIDINLKDNNDKTALAHAIDGSESKNLISIPYKKTYKEIIELLIKASLPIGDFKDINARDTDNKTLLIFAIEKGDIVLAKGLIQINVKFINEQTKENGHTALMIAAKNGSIEIVKALLAAKDIKYNIMNYNKNTALINAAEKGYTEIVKALLAMPEIDINQKNDTDKTALDLAREGRHTEIVKLLNNTKGTLEFKKEINGVILKPTDGRGEESFSINNCVYFNDNPDIIYKIVEFVKNGDNYKDPPEPIFEKWENKQWIEAPNFKWDDTMKHGTCPQDVAFALSQNRKRDLKNLPSEILILNERVNLYESTFGQNDNLNFTDYYPNKDEFALNRAKVIFHKVFRTINPNNPKRPKNNSEYMILVEGLNYRLMNIRRQLASNNLGNIEKDGLLEQGKRLKKLIDDMESNDNNLEDYDVINYNDSKKNRTISDLDDNQINTIIRNFIFMLLQSVHKLEGYDNYADIEPSDLINLLYNESLSESKMEEYLEEYNNDIKPGKIHPKIQKILSYSNLDSGALDKISEEEKENILSDLNDYINEYPDIVNAEYIKNEYIKIINNVTYNNTTKLQKAINLIINADKKKIQEKNKKMEDVKTSQANLLEGLSTLLNFSKRVVKGDPLPQLPNGFGDLKRHIMKLSEPDNQGRPIEKYSLASNLKNNLCYLKFFVEFFKELVWYDYKSGEFKITNTNIIKTIAIISQNYSNMIDVITKIHPLLFGGVDSLNTSINIFNKNYSDIELNRLEAIIKVTYANNLPIFYNKVKDKTYVVDGKNISYALLFTYFILITEEYIRWIEDTTQKINCTNKTSNLSRDTKSSSPFFITWGINLYDLAMGLRLNKKFPDYSNDKKFQQFVRDADNGTDPVAQFKVGISYLKGQDVEQDIPKGLKYLAAAAEKQHLEAQASLGEYYYSIDNFDEAKKYLEMASVRGNSNAKFYLAEILSKDPKTQNEAFNLYNDASNNGNTQASMKIAEIYKKNGDITNAMGIYDKIRKNKKTTDTVIKADIEWAILAVENGNDDEKNKALNIFRKYPNDRESNYFLAKYGNITNPDDISSLFKKSADAGYIPAMFERAKSLYENSKNESDVDKLNKMVDEYTKLLNYGADKNDINSLLLLAEITKDLTYNIRAAALNSDIASYILGEKYESKGNIPEALTYYKKAADLGYILANVKISQLYETGKIKNSDDDSNIMNSSTYAMDAIYNVIKNNRLIKNEKEANGVFNRMIYLFNIVNNRDTDAGKIIFDKVPPGITRIIKNIIKYRGNNLNFYDKTYMNNDNYKRLRDVINIYNDNPIKVPRINSPAATPFSRSRASSRRSSVGRPDSAVPAPVVRKLEDELENERIAANAAAAAAAATGPAVTPAPAPARADSTVDTRVDARAPAVTSAPAVTPADSTAPAVTPASTLADSTVDTTADATPSTDSTVDTPDVTPSDNFASIFGSNPGLGENHDGTTGGLSTAPLTYPPRPPTASPTSSPVDSSRASPTFSTSGFPFDNTIPPPPNVLPSTPLRKRRSLTQPRPRPPRIDPTKFFSISIEKFKKNVFNNRNDENIYNDINKSIRNSRSEILPELRNKLTVDKSENINETIKSINALEPFDFDAKYTDNNAKITGFITYSSISGLTPANSAENRYKFIKIKIKGHTFFVILKGSEEKVYAYTTEDLLVSESSNPRYFKVYPEIQTASVTRRGSTDSTQGKSILASTLRSRATSASRPQSVASTQQARPLSAFTRVAATTRHSLSAGGAPTKKNKRKSSTKSRTRRRKYRIRITSDKLTKKIHKNPKGLNKTRRIK